MNIASMPNACQEYFVHLNPDTRTPILGTMYSKAASHKVTKGLKCLEAILPNYQMSRTNQCFPATGLRYFYRYNPQTMEIIPNSLFSQVGKPSNMCGIYEYIIYSA